MCPVTSVMQKLLYVCLSFSFPPEQGGRSMWPCSGEWDVDKTMYTAWSSMPLPSPHVRPTADHPVENSRTQGENRVWVSEYPTYHPGLPSEKGIIFHGLKPVNLKTCLLTHTADLAEQYVVRQRKERKKGRWRKGMESREGQPGTKEVQTDWNRPETPRI